MDTRLRSSMLRKMIGLALAALLPFMISSNYHLHVLNLVGIYSLVVLGLNLLSGYAGQVSMGHAGYFAVGTYVSALLTMRLRWPFWAGVVAAGIASALCGIVIGIPAMRLSGPYLVMATVGFGEIIRLILVNWVPVTRGAAGIAGIPFPSFLGLKISSEKEFYYLIYGVLYLGTLVALRLSKSKVGRTFVALREDDLAAETMGVPTDRYKIAAFAVSTAYAGIAGALYGPFAGVASPDNFTFEDSVGFLCMSVVGGNRTIYGALIGALLLTVFSEALRFLQSYRLIVYGAILLATVVFMPEGVAGLGPTLIRLRKRFPAFRRGRTGLRVSEVERP